MFRSQKVMLNRSGLFGTPGPEAGDLGETVDKYFIANREEPWFGVQFDDWPGVYSCPVESLEFIDSSLDNLVPV